MAHVIKDYFCCDKCGKTEEVSGGKVWEKENGHGWQPMYNDWAVVGKDYCFCPECKKLILKEMKRHRKRLEEIIGKEATAELVEVYK